MQHSASTLVSTKFDTSIPSRNTSSTYAITIQPRGNSNKAVTKSIKPAYTAHIPYRIWLREALLYTPQKMHGRF